MREHDVDLVQRTERAASLTNRTRRASYLVLPLGERTPPMYGDYEAQRHWMEITLNLPAKDWYKDTSDNNLSYWGLDYPPLSAYASFATGWFVSLVDPAAVALHDSRGYETQTSRAAMRLSVVVTDLLVFFPSLLACVYVVYKKSKPGSSFSCWCECGSELFRSAAFCLSLPALLLVDHAHFQYNNVSLGLFLAALTCFVKEHDVLGSAFFCAAIYFKHMLMYYALAIFAFLVSRMFRLYKGRGAMAAGLYAAKILATIITISCLIFAPWLMDGELLRGMLVRLFPISRGLYEDKVANVWCSVSVLFKVNRWLAGKSLFLFCAIITLLASLPFCVGVSLQPSSTRLLLATFGCSLSAYLFSFQVHEKQILIPLTPIAALHGRYPVLSTWMSIAAAFSLFPLLLREGSASAYAASIAIHVVTAISTPPKFMGFGGHTRRERQFMQWFVLGNATVAVVLNFVLIFGRPPASAPDIFVLLNTAFAGMHFVLIYVVSVFLVFTA